MTKLVVVPWRTDEWVVHVKSVSEKSPPSPPRQAYHYPQVRDAIEGNPEGIVSSSPGLQACELPWDIVQTASQPQRGCGRARHPGTQPRWGWFVLTRWTQGSSLLATLGFVAESLRDSHESSPEMWVMMNPQERVNRARVLWSLEPYGGNP